MTLAEYQAAEDRLREAYLCEAAAMVLILFIGLFWLSTLIAGWWVAKRNEEQLKGEMQMRSGIRSLFGRVRGDSK